MVQSFDKARSRPPKQWTWHSPYADGIDGLWAEHVSATIIQFPNGAKK